MDFKKSTIEELRAHENRLAAVQNLWARIGALEEEATMLRGVSTDGQAVMGGQIGADDRLVNNIAERGRLRSALDITQRLVDIMEHGLALLTTEERTVLHHFFIHRVPSYMDTLCETLGYEERNIYKLKDSALRKLTISMYGVESL